MFRGPCEKWMLFLKAALSLQAFPVLNGSNGKCQDFCCRIVSLGLEVARLFFVLQHNLLISSSRATQSLYQTIIS